MSRKPHKIFAALFLISFLFFQIPEIFGAGFGGARLAEERRSGLVHWVIDGDTFDLETGERVRLIGIDTPEHMPWKNRVDYYGKEASDFSKALLTNKKVYLVSDVEKKDRYGRTLAYVYLENGDFVNKILVLEGYARAKFYKPNGLHYQELKKAETEAKALQKGLWKRLAKTPHSI